MIKMKFPCLILAINCLIFSRCQAQFQTLKTLQGNVTTTLNGLLVGYNKVVRPLLGVRPLPVLININVRSLGQISDRDMSYSMDCYFRQYWKDDRLRFNIPGMKSLSLSASFLNKIWKPDSYFFNGKHSYTHMVPMPNKLLRLDSDGTILYSQRLTINAQCQMELNHFPMDTQVCPLLIGSYAYGEKDLQYEWAGGNPVKISDDVRLPQFSLKFITASKNNTEVKESGRADFFASGQHRKTMLVAGFSLRRHIGHFVIHIYMPCALLVICSYVSFWINREATSERISLSVTTLLTMALLLIDNWKDLPKVAYTTALDWYMVSCFMFVFASIIEFAYVHFFTKYRTGDITNQLNFDPRAKKPFSKYAHENMNQDRDSYMSDEEQIGSVVATTVMYQHYIQKFLWERAFHVRNPLYRLFLGCFYHDNWHRKTFGLVDEINSVSKLDKVARVLFPVFFIGLNALYWYVYLHRSE